jgi:hypothetical protein
VKKLQRKLAQPRRGVQQLDNRAYRSGNIYPQAFNRRLKTKPDTQKFSHR